MAISEWENTDAFIEPVFKKAIFLQFFKPSDGSTFFLQERKLWRLEESEVPVRPHLGAAARPPRRSGDLTGIDRPEESRDHHHHHLAESSLSRMRSKQLGDDRMIMIEAAR